MKKKITYFIFWIVILVSVTSWLSLDWAYKNFGNLTLDEIIFNMKVPMDGTNPDFLKNYIFHVLPYDLFITTIIFLIICYPFFEKKDKRFKKEHNKFIKKIIEIKGKIVIKGMLVILVFCFSFIHICNKSNLIDYLKKQFEK